ESCSRSNGTRTSRSRPETPHGVPAVPFANWYRAATSRRSIQRRCVSRRVVLESLEPRSLLSTVLVDAGSRHAAVLAMTIHAAQAPTAAPVSIGPGSTKSPGPVLTTLTPTVRWKAVTGVTGYQINVYDKSLKKLVSHTVGASETSYKIGAGVLAPGHSFVWNVR